MLTNQAHAISCDDAHSSTKGVMSNFLQLTPLTLVHAFDFGWEGIGERGWVQRWLGHGWILLYGWVIVFSIHFE